VYYLPPLAFKALLTAICETAVVGSRIYFDFINLTTMAGGWGFCVWERQGRG
jgi:O-methyltransferase involved in polyketide biosynthesis